MLLETIKTPGLAHLSYLLGDPGSGVCAVIDPRRDVKVYLNIAQANEVRITHIFETHVHADFVSGSAELASRTGAPVYVGASDAYGFDHHALRDGDAVKVGPFTLRVLHTPGHSPEHICLVVSGGGKGAEHDWAVFTGDTLFAGEVGRPDLAENVKDEAKEVLAGKLYDSLHDKLLTLEDGLEVLPAHGEGSPCGGSIGARDRTTIGYERLYNPKLQVDKEAFTKRVLSGLPAEPSYYARMKRVNARGPDVLGVRPPPPSLTPAQFGAEMGEGTVKDTVVLDVREIDAFAGAHIPRSLNIALRKAFPIWAGWMLKPEQRILLVLPPFVEAAEVQTQLLRIGIEDVVGTLQKGMRGWVEAGKPFETTGRLSVHELKDRLEAGQFQLLDVRNDEEWSEGHIRGARHMFVPFLPQHLDDLDPDEPTAVYCGSGFRSSIAVSILKKHGFSDLYNVLGSVSAWKGAGYELESD